MSDPELERLLAEEEEIERRVHDQQVSVDEAAEVDVVVFAALAVARGGNAVNDEAALVRLLASQTDAVIDRTVRELSAAAGLIQQHRET